MQKRLVRKLDLEIALSKIEPHPSPKAYLEQYTIPPEVAAELLYIATYTYDDIIDKTIADLGCGTGRLAIGSALLGAKEAIGVDIDKAATKTAAKNAEKLGVKERTRWITSDIVTIRGTFDTVLQNPPFGVQRRKADRKFLEKALEIGKHVYSLHKGRAKNYRSRENLRERSPRFSPVSPSPFLKRFIEKHGGKIKAVYSMPMTIPHMFKFHRKQKHQFPVFLYVIEKET
jgi:putative methylase